MPLADDERNKKLLEADTDLPYTEVKYEASVDRITSKANPRPLERVPADTVFGPFEMVFSIYEATDIALLAKLFEAMRLLEDDYLGGSGSRGSGKVRFKDIKITAKSVTHYAYPDKKLPVIEVPDLQALLEKVEKIEHMARNEIFPEKEEGHA